jgi:outer membrane protein TolC
LSLDEALDMAERASEAVGIARVGVERARGQQYEARSQLFPQLSVTASYVRALRSEYQGLNLTSGPPDTRPLCRVFTPPQGGLTTQQRLDSLEQALALSTNCQPASAGGVNFSSLPFGRANTWRWELDASQTVFAGGRVVAQTQVANAGRRTAEIGLASARAQMVLDVVQAYYDAALSDRLYAIAQATLQQAETTLVQTRLARQVGTQPEFDLLRAQVTRDNQLPAVIQQRTNRELAYLRLKQLLGLPLGQPVALTSGLADSVDVTVPARVVVLDRTTQDTATEHRAPVRQAAEAVQTEEAQLRIARAEHFPQLSVGTQYGRVAYPTGALPDWAAFRTNWNVSVNLSVPLFTGGRIRGDEVVAQANLSAQRLQLQQMRKLAELDTRNALAQLEAAEASWQASAGTAGQAARAYQIAEVRYREGISTQTELSDSRILLQQAHANRAQAARDLQVARVRVALLRDLPLGTTGAGAQGSGAGQQQQLQQQQQQQPQQPQQPSRTTTQTQTTLTGATVPGATVP